MIPSSGGTIHAVQRTYTDGLNGQTVFTYHARIEDLLSGFVCTDYSGHRGQRTATLRSPFSGDVPHRALRPRAFRWFTSFGDLATPNTAWVLSYGQSQFAVQAVEKFQPLFHLLNGDLCYANLNPTAQPQVWRDFGNNNQASAANRPWMPVPGNHEIEFGNGPQGFSSYLTRYALPANGFGPFEGRWYSFRVGSVLFVSLSADDVVYQDAGAFVAGPAALVPAPSTGNPPVPAGTSFYVRGYSGGAQTRWLEATLAAARRDASVDWIIAQLHQCACSSSRDGNGSDLGIRESWLPLFDRYEVDLVLCGHDHDYERSFPVRGFDPAAGTSVATGAPVDTRRPHPVTTVDSGVFDTSQGTVHLVLGCGGTDANLDVFGAPAAGRPDEAKVFTTPNRPVRVRDPRRLRPAGRRRGGGRDLVGTPRHRDRVRHRGVRREPWHGGGRPDVDHGHALPRAWRRPGEPVVRRAGRADRRLHRLRDVHPGPAPVRRPALAREAIRLGDQRLSRVADGAPGARSRAAKRRVHGGAKTESIGPVPAGG